MCRSLAVRGWLVLADLALKQPAAAASRTEFTPPHVFLTDHTVINPMLLTGTTDKRCTYPVLYMQQEWPDRSDRSDMIFSKI